MNILKFAKGICIASTTAGTQEELNPLFSFFTSNMANQFECGAKFEEPATGDNSPYDEVSKNKNSNKNSNNPYNNVLFEFFTDMFKDKRHSQEENKKPYAYKSSAIPSVINIDNEDGSIISNASSDDTDARYALQSLGIFRINSDSQDLSLVEEASFSSNSSNSEYTYDSDGSESIQSNLSFISNLTCDTDMNILEENAKKIEKLYNKGRGSIQL